MRKGVYSPSINETNSVSRKKIFNLRNNNLQIEACCKSFRYLEIGSGCIAFLRLNNNQIYIYMYIRVYKSGYYDRAAVAYLWPLILSSCRSQHPLGLRRWSAAARLLRVWVRIPPGAWMPVVSVVYCLVHRSPTKSGASLSVI